MLQAGQRSDAADEGEEKDGGADEMNRAIISSFLLSLAVQVQMSIPKIRKALSTLPSTETRDVA